MYGRALFIHAHGHARIHVKISEFSFKVEPRLKADGDTIIKCFLSVISLLKIYYQYLSTILILLI